MRPLYLEMSAFGPYAEGAEALKPLSSLNLSNTSVRSRLHRNIQLLRLMLMTVVY